MPPTPTEREVHGQRLALHDKLLLVVALFVPWLLIWQGLDVTDQGYLLTIYRQFLHHPESVAQSAHMWLTNMLGALWDAVFGGWGVIVHRAQWATCLSLGLLLAFHTVRKVTSDRAAAIGVLVTALFVCNRREVWFSYNSLTALINAGAVAALARGLNERNERWLVVGGALLGISPFARLPNLLGLSLLVAPVFVAVIQPERRKRLLREQASLLAGCVAGAALLLAVIWVSGYLPVYRQGLASLFAPSVDDTGHGKSALIAGFLSDQGRALLAGAGGCVLLLLLHWSGRSLPRPARLAGYAVVALACVYALGQDVKGADADRWRFYFVGVCEIGLAGVALGLRARPELRVTAFLALWALVVTPLGSDQGIRNAHWGIWTALPLLIAMLGSLEPSGVRWRDLRDLSVFVAAAVAFEGLARIGSYTYRDGPREALLHSVESSQLRGILTTERRAKAMSEVLTALTSRVAEGDYLLTSESTPLLQYLTRTRPYLGIPWLMVDEDLAQIEALLAAAPRSHGCLPVVVRAKGNTRSALWPSDVRKGVDRKHGPARKLVAAFLKRHDYARSWQNSYFEILSPPATHGAACR